MSTYKHHIKTDHDGDAENFRSGLKDLEKLAKERGDDLSPEDLLKFLRRFLSGLESHKVMMSQNAETLYPDIRPQSHLVAPLEAGQPYNRFQVIREDNKAAGAEDDLSKLVPDHVQLIIGPMPEPELRAVRRAGQPELPARPNVAIEFAHLVKVEDDERPA